MNSYLKRRAGSIGLAAVAAALLIVLFVGTVSAQGAAPQDSWGNRANPQNGVTGTVPYGYGYGYGCGWDDGWMGGPGYGYNPQNNVPNTTPNGYNSNRGGWGYGMMDGWGYGMMGNWSGYGYNPQSNVPNTTPNGYNPQTNVPTTTPNGYNSNRGSWGHGMMSGHRSWGGYDR